jgi:transcriptional regulator with XRE-family HTH domain
MYYTYNHIPINSMKTTDKIREIRTQKNLSQEYLASYLGIDTSSYHRLERGVSPLSIQRLEKIVDALEMTLPELFSFGEPIVQRKTQDLLILRLEDEIRFLRSQLQEKINYTSNQHATMSPFATLDSTRISRLK